MTDIDVAKKLISLRNSAESRNIPFDLSYKHVKKLMLQKTCFYTCIKFDDNSKNSKYQRTIDRKDNSLGYTDDNTVACTSLFNNRKGCLELKDIEILYNKLIKNKK